MKARFAVPVAVLALAASTVPAERAQPREGADRSGSAAASGTSHHSNAGSREPSRSSFSGSTSSSSKSSSRATPRTDAERRHPRPGTGTGGYHRGRRYGGYVYRYDPYWYSGYYGRFSYGYWPYGWYSWGYHPGYAYSYRDYDDEGSLRLLVRPSEARVYVDGYYAGVVDDYDGLFQRLKVAPGRHELAFKLEGYKTYRVRLYVPGEHTTRVEHRLERGDGDAVVDESLDKPALEWSERERERQGERERRYARREREERRYEREAERDEAADVSGGLRLKVQPDDASVYVDGRFRGTGAEVGELDLSPGRHRVEVVRPGYRTFDREIEIGEAPQTLDVQLERP